MNGKSIVEYFEGIILNEAVMEKFQFIAANLILALVSLIMTMINFIVDRGPAFACLFLALVCIANVVLSFVHKYTYIFARIIFVLELFVVLIYFIISGNPEGFSANWIILLPSCALILYKRKIGTVISTFGLLLLLFFYYLPWGESFLQYDYSEVYMGRFPILYFTLFMFALFFDVVRQMTYDKLVEVQDEYKTLYRRDALTGVMNRYGFDAELKSLIINEDYTIKQLVFMIFDLDHFKSINDTYGHDVGDIVLRESVNKISQITKGKVCRWGGEEFALLMTNRALTANDIDGYCKEFAKNPIVVDKLSLHITVSIGAIIVEDNVVPSIDKLYREADECLYLAKNNGRNRAIIKKYG